MGDRHGHEAHWAANSPDPIAKAARGILFARYDGGLPQHSAIPAAEWDAAVEAARGTVTPIAPEATKHPHSSRHTPPHTAPDGMAATPIAGDAETPLAGVVA